MQLTRRTLCSDEPARKLTIPTEEFSFFLMEIQARLVLAEVCGGEEKKKERRKNVEVNEWGRNY
jgi:hypothetical protein